MRPDGTPSLCTSVEAAWFEIVITSRLRFTVQP